MRNYLATITDGHSSVDVWFSGNQVPVEELVSEVWISVRDQNLECFPRGRGLWVSAVRDADSNELLLSENL